MVRIKIPKKELITLFLSFLLLLIASNATGSDEPDLRIEAENIHFSRLNPRLGDDVAIYALIFNEGPAAEACVRFYVGNEKSLIGEETIIVDADSSTVASVYWQPSYGACKIFVSIEDVNPSDSNLSNNQATVDCEFYESAAALEIKSGVATIEEGLERVIPVEIEAFFELTLVNVTIIYQGDLEVTLQSPLLNMSAREVSKFYLRIKVPNLKGEEDFENKTILLQASNGEYKSNVAELRITMHSSVETSDWLHPTAAAAAGTIGFFAVIGSTEIGKNKFLSLALPLYTKLNRVEILDHYTRGKIHGYILANPGDHYNSIKKALGISNGSFAYHLHVLEREGMIKSKRDGLFKRFYPFKAQVSQDNGSHLNDTQKIIVKKIRETPGITQKDIATMMGVSRSTINYHINKLTADEIVSTVRWGISVQYYLNPNKEWILSI